VTKHGLLTVLRWIAVLPVAIVGGVLAGMLSNVLNRFSFGWIGMSTQWWLPRIYIEGMANLIAAATAIYLGAVTAPSHSATVGLVLAGMLLIGEGYVLYPSIARQNWWSVYAGVTVIVAAILSAWWIHAGEAPFAFEQDARRAPQRFVRD
jgi:hypothetical protein